MKTSELEGAQLDEWVAKSQKIPVVRASDGRLLRVKSEGGILDEIYSPTTNPAQWAGLIEGFKVSINWFNDDWYIASIAGTQISVGGPTPAIAVCRAVVASIYGEEVDDEKT